MNLSQTHIVLFWDKSIMPITKNQADKILNSLSKSDSNRAMFEDIFVKEIKRKEYGIVGETMFDFAGISKVMSVIDYCKQYDAWLEDDFENLVEQKEFEKLNSGKNETRPESLSTPM